MREPQMRLRMTELGLAGSFSCALRLPGANALSLLPSRNARAYPGSSAISAISDVASSASCVSAAKVRIYSVPQPYITMLCRTACSTWLDEAPGPAYH